MTAALVVFESKYGVSEALAGHIGRVLGPARVCRAGELLHSGALCDQALSTAEFVVVVAPIYRHVPDERVLEFVRARSAELRARRVALVCVGLATSAGAVRAYLQPLTDVLGDCVVWTGGLGGRIALDWLDAPDRDDIERAQDMRGHRGLGDLDAYSAEAVAEAALAIKAVRDSFARTMPAGDLRAHIDDFLSRHATCTLCTGAGGHVRATPVEYGYQNGLLYLLSEGGEKFAHLLVNPHVSVAVYDPFQGMDKLAGLQLLGVAELVPDDSAERAEALQLRGLDEVHLAALPFALTLIRVRVERAEFLWSGFAGLGFDVRQTYLFPPAEEASRPDPAPPSEPRA
jgi:Flavodoxin domain/Pyridoxamine 5'-phosphate oxidase